MTIGQSINLDTTLTGLIADGSAQDSVAVAIVRALIGTVTITDGNGNVVFNKTAGQSGAFTVAGKIYRMNYALSSASDLGAVIVSWRPI